MCRSKLRILSWLVCLLILVSLTDGLGNGQDAPSEYQVKAVFLYNFAKFVEWPSHAAASPSDPIVLAVLGDDPFGQTLEDTLHGKSANGRPIAIRRLKSDKQLNGCQIIFVSGSEKDRLREIFRSLRNSEALTIGDSAGFAQEGGIINFVLQENHVRFEVNIDAAERAHLKISSKLLSLAKVVRDEH